MTDTRYVPRGSGPTASWSRASTWRSIQARARNLANGGPKSSESCDAAWQRVASSASARFDASVSPVREMMAIGSGSC
jgi:hypothetical protein